MLCAFSGSAFYNRYVVLPKADDPTPLRIQEDPKLFPFFKDAIGAIDGTHLNCHPSLEEREASRDRKGGVTQNCLAACSFDLRFTFIYSGWEGSVSDSFLFHEARKTSLPIPPGKFYLADAGFPGCLSLMIPYRGVRYHLAEWGRAGLRWVVSSNVIYIFGILIYPIYTALKMRKSCTTYDMLLHVTWLNVFLEF